MVPTFTPASVESYALGPTPVYEFLRRARRGFGPDCVAFGGFRIVGATTADWLLQHTLEGTRYDLSSLLRSSALTDTLPELAHGVNRDRMFNFDMVDPMALVASLASALVGHLPDDLSPARPAPAQARDLTTAFLDALVGERLWQATVLESRAAWSEWFACDVWDRTWVIVDTAGSLVWLLCLSSPPPPRRS